jgi:GNAT superfamily N-acetyltransferase
MAAVTFRAFQPGDEAAFRDLNEAWIKPLFGMEPKDYEVLSDPRKYILSKGGHVFLGFDEATPVACCALIPREPGCFEVSKMTVNQDRRGTGLGRKLLEYTVGQARAIGATRLYLESNTKLADAVHLYESSGFTHVPPERVQKSPYARSNVHMEMTLQR